MRKNTDPASIVTRQSFKLQISAQSALFPGNCRRHGLYGSSGRRAARQPPAWHAKPCRCARRTIGGHGAFMISIDSYEPFAGGHPAQAGERDRRHRTITLLGAALPPLNGKRTRKVLRTARRGGARSSRLACRIPGAPGCRLPRTGPVTCRTHSLGAHR